MPKKINAMDQKKDYLLLFLVTVMTVIVILPDEYQKLIGVERNYLFFGLVIIVSITLVYYAKFVLVAAVFTLVIGANLPDAIAQLLNVDSKYLMGSLIALVLIALANRVIKMPTGLDKPQGMPIRPTSVELNHKKVEYEVALDGDGLSAPNKYIHSVSGCAREDNTSSSGDGGPKII